MLLDIVPDAVLTQGGISVSVVDKLIDSLLDNAVVLGQRLLVAAIVFFVGRWIISWLRKFIDRFLERRQIEETVKTFLDSLASITLQVILFLFIVNILGISTTSFAALIAAVGLAVGMAMKDNLANFAGGVMLLVNKPIKVGDRILSQGMDGTVKSIGILYTILLTGDNRTIYIPNGPLSTGNIINYSTQKSRRIDIVLNLNYGSDFEDVKASILSVLGQEKRLINIPSEPFVGITAINNGTIDVTIRAWVLSADFSAVNVSLNEVIYKLFADKGIYAASTLNVRMIAD